LDELAALGINAIELMPIQAFPGDSSWGYNPVFFFAPAATYGTADDLRRLVNSAHHRGMAVLLDVAFNHAWGEHPWYRSYPPMFGPQGEWLEALNPFFHQTPQVVNAWGGVDWDHFTQPATAHFQDVVRFWLDEFHIDGFRFDWVCGVDYDHREPMRPGCHPYHGIAAIAWAARQAKPDCILIGEYWQLDGTHPEKTGARLLAETELDAIWNGHFHHTMDEAINQRWQWERRDLAGAIGGFGALGYANSTQVINYTCSHDEVRPEHEIHYYTGGWIERPAGMNLTAMALARARLGLVALLAGAGVPMIYAGQEYGERSPRTVDFLPLDWSLRERPLHTAHEAIVRRLIHARRSHPALRSDAIAFDPIPLAESKLLRFWRWDDHGGSDAAAIALNFAP
ncbi:MAG: alpha-amylase family glycosyl hydrolase, partial [Caldilineaceae bacterium]